MRRWFIAYAPDQVVALASVPYHYLIKVPRRFALELGERFGIIGPDTLYNDEFYDQMRNEQWQRDANIVVSALQEEFSPNRVLDLGCGVGLHLKAFHDRGVDIHGVEGNSSAIERAVIPKSHITKHDLRKPYNPNQAYDIVLCFEVLEHISERFADNLVATIANASDVAVVTAATPGQGGTHHVNEQPHTYWIDKFEDERMVFDREPTARLRSKMPVNKTPWIPENLMVFRRA